MALIKGNGSISYDKQNNSYRAFVVTPIGKRISKRFKLKSDAVEWKNNQLADISRREFIAPSDRSLGEWAITWLDTYKKDSIKQRTYERYMSLTKHLAPIANTKLQDLMPAQIQKLYKELPLSASTINKVHKLLKDMLNKAVELEMIRKNMLLMVKPPRYDKKGIEIFTQSEVELILSSAYNDARYKRYYPIILLAAVTGARLGELLGLRWCDILFVSNQIYIRQSLQNSSQLGLILESPKTAAGVRKISVPISAFGVMKELKAHVMDIKQETLCFRTRNGTPLAPNNFERNWKKLLISIDIPYRNFHVLRHTHATELLAAGTPLADAARRLGHSRISHTYELYGHAMPGTDAKIADYVGNLYAIPNR